MNTIKNEKDLLKSMNKVKDLHETIKTLNKNPEKNAKIISLGKILIDTLKWEIKDYAGGKDGTNFSNN